MKRIIFMRHGKAEAHDTNLPDYERSLTIKGKSLSHLMAAKLKEKINNPGLLISSPAFRALETALIFAMEYDIKPESILLRSDLYFRFSEKTMMQILLSDALHYDSVVFFGHDPSFTNLANYLSREVVGNVPKSGIVCLSFDIRQWDEAGKGKGSPELIFLP
ncbi:MAG TPA: histidine phosphatase family protein [Bacteroidales bacterium]|nr:histidine phosphatase family protein [Bacteroidales bacterium]HRR93073.1 histidine phosphatase family protein [Bacteroidales bacterium]HRT90587.1 histidine phosphatase family protein [Bacteroidales bacterium]